MGQWAKPLFVRLRAGGGDPASKKLPTPPAPVTAVLTQCGKVRRTVQAQLLSATTEALVGPPPGVRMPMGVMIASANPKAARAVQAITADYRAWLQDIVERCRTAVSSSGARRRGTSRRRPRRNFRTEEARMLPRLDSPTE